MERNASMTTKIDKYEYSIDENNVISVWNTEMPNDDVPGNPPFLLQPHYPDGSEFENADAAKAWVENAISEWLTPPPAPEEVK